MLEFWKRKEKLTAMKWGMIDFEKNEVTRPGNQWVVENLMTELIWMLFLQYFVILEFRGGLTKSLIDGKEILFFSDKERQPLIYQSMLIIGSMIALVIGVVRVNFTKIIFLNVFYVSLMSSLLLSSCDFTGYQYLYHTQRFG